MRTPAAAALAAAVLAGCGSSPGNAARPCAPQVRKGVLPPWARTGFSERRPRMPHALGRSGRIAALLFSFPLRVPHGRPQNKILWVPRRALEAPTALRIRAQRMTGARPVGDPVTRVLPDGPGPSTVDLPTAGCWRLRLRWAGSSDELDVAYVARKA